MLHAERLAQLFLLVIHGDAWRMVFSSKLPTAQVRATKLRVTEQRCAGQPAPQRRVLQTQEELTVQFLQPRQTTCHSWKKSAGDADDYARNNGEALARKTTAKLEKLQRLMRKLRNKIKFP
jgi:hypothetical protein